MFARTTVQPCHTVRDKGTANILRLRRVLGEGGGGGGWEEEGERGRGR